ncbi:hypothetical protein HDV05_006365, partial [Chytridiales sp. JEL 0842]
MMRSGAGGGAYEILSLEDGTPINQRPNRRQYHRDSLAAAANEPFHNEPPLPTSPISSEYRSRSASPKRLLIRKSKTDGSNPSSPVHNQALSRAWVKLIKESLPSLLFGLFGLLLAGSLLDALPTWYAFQEVSVLFALVPTLLGLKGNLEMSLSSRLSTAANVGVLDEPGRRGKVILGNLALLQIQSSCVAGLASAWSLIVSGMTGGTWSTTSEAALVCAAGIISGSLASLFLGMMMCSTVVICRVIGVDADNVGAPVAASLGDLITLLILAAVSSFLKNQLDTPIPVLCMVLILSILPMWVYIVLNNQHVRSSLQEGWTSLLGAMTISSVAGLFLERYISRFIGLGILLPVMNGLCGNLACIYASRISTELHQKNFRRKIGLWDPVRVALFGINLPAQGLFLVLVGLLKLGDTTLDWGLICVYIICSVALLSILLVIAENVPDLIWQRGLDPDNYVFSLITSVGDVIGTILIVIGFQILVWTGDTTVLIEKPVEFGDL